MEPELKDIITQQRKALAALDAELARLADRDVMSENAELKKKLGGMAATVRELSESERALKSENRALKNSLYEQFFSEKLEIVKRSREKMEIFISHASRAADRNLRDVENKILGRLNQQRAALESELPALESELQQKVADLSAEIGEKIAEKRRQAGFFRMPGGEAAEYDELAKERLTREQIGALAKKNNFEKFLGLNVMNAIGILLLIVGVVSAANFVQLRMTDGMRSAAIFALGLALLVGGELVNRRKPGVFSLGITAGGVAILYVGIAVSVFAFGVLGNIPALLICAAVTACAFLLSTRHDSQVILTMSLVGGYLPAFGLDAGRAALFGLMAYFSALNLLALFVAFRKKWSVATFAGLGLTLLGMVLILDAAPWPPGMEYRLALGYAAFAWLTYIAIPLVGTYRTKGRFAKRDVALLSITTFFGAAILFYHLIGAASAFNLHAAASAALALAYFGISYAIPRKFDGERPMAALFFIAGLTFAVLFAAFLLDASWWSAAWLTQALGLALYGIVKERRGFLRGGAAVGSVGLAWFLLFDAWLFGMGGEGPGFALRYAALTAAGFAVLLAMGYRNNLHGFWQKGFKYAVFLNLWFFALYGISEIRRLLTGAFPDSLINIDYLSLSSMGMATILLSLVFPRLGRFVCGGLRGISTALGVAGIAGIFALNLGLSPVAGPMAEMEAAVVVFAAFALLLDSGLSAYAVFDVARRAVAGRRLGIQYLPLICSGYVTVISTVNMVNQFGLGFASFWVTLVYALAAVLWSGVGFWKRYATMRLLGLVMAFLSVGKFFLVDTFVLAQGLRILSYFALGVSLLAISFVYQYFSRRLEKSAGV